MDDQTHGPFAELMPKPTRNLHQGNLLRRGYAALTQNPISLRDGISEAAPRDDLKTPTLLQNGKDSLGIEVQRYLYISFCCGVDHRS